MAIAYQNTIKVVAVPHLANGTNGEYDPKNLIYQWSMNGTVFEEQSGYGRQFMTIQGGNVPHPFAINVKVSSRDGISTTEGTISITPGSPSLSFYSNDSLYGPLYNKAVKDGVSIGSQKETSILATPYGFNKPANSIGSLQFQWTINNNYSPDLDNIDSIVLRAPDNTSGSSDIALKIQNTKEFLQQANASFLADFNSTQNPQTSTQVTF